MKRTHANSFTVKVTFVCPHCEEWHTLEADELDTKHSGCHCCSDEQYVTVPCPKGGGRVEVSLY